MATARLSPLLLRSLRSSTIRPLRPLRPFSSPLIVLPSRSAAFSSSSPKPPPPASSSASSNSSKIYTFEDISTHLQHPSTSSPILLIDTREPSELATTGRIPGSINIPITSAPDAFFISAEEFEDRFGFERPSKDTEVVFYCKAGVRSRAAAGLARGAGWVRVGEYPGSWLDWEGRRGVKEGGR